METNSQNLFCGIAFNYHDSSVSFAVGRKVVLVLEAERVFRQKKKVCSAEEMEYLVRYGLDQLQKKIEDVDHWSMTTFNNPFLKHKDVVDEKMKVIREPYWDDIFFFGSKRRVFVTNHHISHAGMCLATPFKSSIIISCDGGGDIDPATQNNECMAVFKCHGEKVYKQNISLKKIITGKTYCLCSAFIFGSDLHTKNPSEGKFMALAGFGKVKEEYLNFLESVYDKLENNNYPEALRILENSPLSWLRGQAANPTNDAKDFAASVNEFFIRKRMENIDSILEEVFSGEEALVLTGGTGLNLDLNTKIWERYPDLKHFIAPSCDDTGQSLGSLCLLISDVTKLRPTVNFPYLGEGEEKYVHDADVINQVVDLLIKGSVLIIHNGKAEVGPRALGNRSFVIRPDDLRLKSKLSEKIKKREWYRPVAPIIVEEKLDEYFIGPAQSHYMLYKYKVISSKIEEIIGAVHVDGSARVQTVNKEENKFLYDLINRFGEKTGKYLLLNTSLNLSGEPLSNKIEESLDIYSKIDGPKVIVYNGKLLLQSLN